MTLHIQDAETHTLVREVGRLRGEEITEMIRSVFDAKRLCEESECETALPQSRTALVMASPAFGISNAVSASPLKDENLITSVPKGFVIGNQGQKGSMLIAEYVPQGETVSDWSQMITVQVFRNLGKFDPDKFVEGIKAQWQSACPGSEVEKIKDGLENGYPVSLWLFTCPLNTRTGKPENMFTKIISGNDSLYSIQYAYRSALTKEIIPPTMAYLGGIQVCDTRLADRPCPFICAVR